MNFRLFVRAERSIYVRKNFTFKYIYPIATLLWIIIIFSFSLQPGTTSSNLSSGFGQWFIRTFLPFAEEFFMENWDMVHLIIRKAGHFTEFFVLGILMRSTLQQYAYRVQASLGGSSWLMCLVVAACDETIQLFIGGRAGQVSDVILDSCGAFIGIIICSFFLHRLRR